MRSNEEFANDGIRYEQIVQLKLQVLERIKSGNVDVETAIRDIVDTLEGFSIRKKAEAIRRLFTEIKGYGAIQPYLDDRSISEIMINGLESFFIERSGRIESEVHPFESESQLLQLIYRVAAEVGREVNQAHPILDARLADGSRVNIILPPLSLRGAVITIRKFNPTMVGEAEMIGTGMLSESLSRFLKAAVAARYNLFLCGGTGSGKTTLLNYLCRAIRDGERVITIEDAAEIDMSNHPHVISLETRNASQREYSVDMSRLIKNALRMRPDRIIVGEVRGEEVLDMLQAMNTGHDGSISTGHSNSALDMLVRLEVIAANHTEIDSDLIRKQIVSAIDLIVFIERFPNGRRVIEGVYEMEKERDEYRLNPIYQLGDDPRTPEELENRVKNSRKFERYRNRSRSFGL